MANLFIMWLVMIKLAKSDQGNYTDLHESITGNNVVSHPSLLLSMLTPTTETSKHQEEGQSSEVKQKCCENGGLCVMGVFCHCTGKYHGQRCEFERKPCGDIAHYQWARLGCNLCRCFDAKMHCLTRVYEGCDDKPPKTDVDTSDYLNDREIFPADSDSDYDNYGSGDYSYNEDDRVQRSGSSKLITHLLTMLLVIVTVMFLIGSPWQVLPFTFVIECS
ncbi:uncharacterized protein LOC106059111 isoform X1 [Biomphalaria glabrata]|uniref:Uncharacterized protein LOC106059111 isoform X1 n=3 Tax=Biomphalaria glabrata TaxID=6526 RepID=A0A9U8E491_BIOGL|nr:uncharacterized protein LOC106059111 isoform X1 [Biomphalaria glabrata]